MDIFTYCHCGYRSLTYRNTFTSTLLVYYNVVDMKIVIAPQTFKGSISALNAALAIQTGVLTLLPDAETILVPVADGGDGTLETLVEGSGGTIRTASVTGPLGERREAPWGAMGDGVTAVIEMARTSGLALVPLDSRDPMNATTYGLGEAISAALDEGFRRFIVGIGGSATNDAGAGMAQVMGAKLTDQSGNIVRPGGAALGGLHHIDLSDLDSRVSESTFMVACDVTNPLTGPEGASAIYGPQKGASPAMVEELDSALSNFAEVVRRDLGVDVETMQGSGAAGGLGGGMVAFLSAELRAGVDIIMDTVNIHQHLEGADLVITGEGALDFQTVYNKAPVGVAQRARRLGVPVVAIAGTLGDRYEMVHEHGIEGALPIPRGPMTLEAASEQAAELITETTERMLRLMQTGARVFGRGPA